MRILIVTLLLISSQAEAGFFFKRRPAPIPIPPKEITFKKTEDVKMPYCDHLDQITCILDNAIRFYPDKNNEQLSHIQALMILKNYAYLNVDQPHLTESKIQDSFVEAQMMYDSLKKRDIEIQSVEKWKRYFVGEVIVSALNAHYSEKK